MKKVIFDYIVETIAAYYGITVKELRKVSRKSIYVMPRQQAMYFMLTERVGTSTEIADYFDKDHVTVLHAKNVVQNEIENYSEKRKDYQILRKHLIKKAEVDFVITKLLANPKDVLTAIREKLEAA